MSNANLPSSRNPPTILGAANIVRLAYHGADLTPLCECLQARIDANPLDAAAFVDLALILEVSGQRALAMAAQAQALSIAQEYTIEHGKGDGLRIVVFKAAGDLMANTPIEFLLEGSNTVLHLRYISVGTSTLDALPDHDVAFLAIGESLANRPVLDNLPSLLAGLQGPILNNAPGRIRELTRTGVASSLRGVSSVYAPEVTKLGRDTLRLVANRVIGSTKFLPKHRFPVIVRPFGSHAGIGMTKVNNRMELAGYLAKQQDDLFYVTEFIDYAGPDGLFRKYRVAIIDGQPFASHMAISNHWMVHYLNADMEKNASRRAKEAEWMRDFDSAFAVRHASAFEILAHRIGLDYFAIDCAEMTDGRLLLFEADVAMIVHSLDSTSLFPYKKPTMQKLFDGFLRAFQRRHDHARSKAIAEHDLRAPARGVSVDELMR